MYRVIIRFVLNVKYLGVLIINNEQIAKEETYRWYIVVLAVGIGDRSSKVGCGFLAIIRT